MPQAGPTFTRSPGCIAKLERMRAALTHREADCVPVSDFFWGSFLRRWREELALAHDADIYRYYDLDWQATIPNMDPHIRTFEVIRENEQEVVVRTGFGAVIRKRFDQARPAFLGFDTASLDQLEAFQFDDAWDERRYFHPGDNQIAGVGDGFERQSPAWVEKVRSLHADFPVFGSVCEGHELLWRIVGSENTLLWMAAEPERLGRQIERICAFAVELVQAQIRAADGMLDGMVIWGDIAYKKGMLFSPVYWRKWFLPGVQEIVRVCHSYNLPVIYHGCGNARRAFPDLIAAGVDAYNPLEAKSGLDVVDLRRDFGHRLAFCGNMDAQIWANGTLEELQYSALRKLNAAKGGGYIFQSDHSVPGNVSAERYEYVLTLVRRFGRYPLHLGEFDISLE